MCEFSQFMPLYVGVLNRNLNCVRNCLVREDSKAQSDGRGGGAGSEVASKACPAPNCLPDDVIDNYHKKCYEECGVSTIRYLGVNPLDASPDSFFNPNRRIAK